MVKVRERELLMERCSPEEMATAAATATTTMAAAALGGSGPCPPYSLEMVLQWRGLSPP